MGVPLVGGRAFTWADDASAPPVAMVDEAFVRRFWPDQDPIGRRFRMSDGPWATVVGVVGDVRHGARTDELLATFYVPVAQWEAMTGGNPTSLRLVVATAVAEGDVVQPIRDAVRELDASLALAEVRTVDDLVTASVAQPRFTVVLMGVFSGIALLLALVGIYGVIAYGVGQRRREIGVRMALGAMQDQVVGLMLRRGAAMVGVGLAAGAALAVVFARLLESLLYGIEPTDPLTFVGVIGAVTLVAAAAIWLPARRAARIDPLQALKAE
jgi:putative ABC transport system permease protein